MNAAAAFFYLFAGVTVASAFMVVTSRNPVHSVLYLILTTLWGLIQRQIERAVSRGDVSQDSVRRRSAPWKRAVRA